MLADVWRAVGVQAIGQICSTASMAHNLGQCVRLLSRAAEAGAEVRVVLPFVLMCPGRIVVTHRALDEGLCEGNGGGCVKDEMSFETCTHSKALEKTTRSIVPYRHIGMRRTRAHAQASPV